MLDEVAAALDISQPRRIGIWAFARIWLARMLRKTNDLASLNLIFQKFWQVFRAGVALKIGPQGGITS